MKLTLRRRIIELSNFMDQNRQWRSGQSYINALYYINPELYSKIHSTESDCFYQDSKIDKFFETIEAYEKKEISQ